MAETVAEEIARLQREIGERQSRLQFLVLGDPRIGSEHPKQNAMPTGPDRQPGA